MLLLRQIRTSESRLPQTKGRYIAKRDNENAAKFASEKPSNDSDSEESESEENMTKLGFNAHHTNKTALSKKFKAILKGEKVLKCTIQGNTYPSFTESTWYGDSGASCHITNDDTDMYHVEEINELI